MSFKLDYDQLIHLDAEDLAEGGIGEAYDSLLRRLRELVPDPAEIEELLDSDAGSYAVRCGAKQFAVYGPQLEEGESNSWGRATVALFSIVNDQLESSEYRLFAINGGNDLGGMFLTPAQAQAAQQTLPNKTDWPYLPREERSWYGQYH
jgi:hypothetical protein